MFKLDSEGQQVWDLSLGENKEEACYGIVVKDDGTIVATGINASIGAGNQDMYLMKISADGQLIWDTVYGGPEFDTTKAVIQDSDGNIVVSGDSVSFGPGQYNVWLLKYDQAGNKLWDKVYGTESEEIGFDLTETSDGHYLIGGIWPGAVSNDFLLMKVDQDGNEVWKTVFGGDFKEMGFGVAEHPEGGYLLAGKSTSPSQNDSNFDLALAKVDSFSELEWERYWQAGGNDSFESVLVLPDGKIVAAGNTGGDGVIVLTDERGYAPLTPKQ